MSVTGSNGSAPRLDPDPLMPLTARQREAARLLTIEQVRTLTQKVAALEKDRALAWELIREHETKIASLAKEQGATQESARVFYGASLYRRLRWLVTGR